MTAPIDKKLIGCSLIPMPSQESSLLPIACRSMHGCPVTLQLLDPAVSGISCKALRPVVRRRRVDISGVGWARLHSRPFGSTGPVGSQGEAGLQGPRARGEQVHLRNAR